MVPVQELAEHRAAAKDLCPPGTVSPPSPVHLVLPPLPDSHLLNILSDIGVSVDRNTGSPSSFLSLIRLNEEAQAAIARAKKAATKSTVAAEASVADRVMEDSGPPPTNSKKGLSSKPKSCLSRAGRVFALKNSLLNESLILEHPGFRC